MNAKELRAAAGFVQRSDEESDQRKLTKAVHSVTSHILATVREDDDEPFDLSKAAKAVGEYIELRESTEWLTIIDHEGESLIVATAKLPRTMGQFRKLCQGLGIVLKE